MSNTAKPYVFYAGSVALLIIGVVVTLAAFKWEQPCDIDNVNFWCRVHPMTILDIVGYALFAIGIIYQCYLWIVHWNTWIDKKILNSLGILILAVGFVLMWLK